MLFFVKVEQCIHGIRIMNPELSSLTFDSSKNTACTNYIITRYLYVNHDLLSLRLHSKIFKHRYLTK